jgi:spore protease
MNQSFRTDLAIEKVESIQDLGGGVKQNVYEKEGVKVTEVTVTDDITAYRLGKAKGKYITIDCKPFSVSHDNFEGELSVISDVITDLIPKDGLILVAGLGNTEITPDAIGPKTAIGVLATRHVTEGPERSEIFSGFRPVAVMAPGVLGQTGIETAEFIHSVCESVSPKAVIAVDALASSSVDRMGSTVQITDTGISPGSGVQNMRKELNVNTLGVPVVAVGIPTVVDAAGIASQNHSEVLQGCMVTPREIDVIVEKASSMLALAINKALQPSLTVEELMGLTQ